jgi:magnesium transporter
MDSEDQVAESFEKYNLVSAAVLDDKQHLVGRITIDDVVDVMRERADHSVMARAGLKEEEDLFAPVARSARSRAVWLGVNLVTAIIASWVIGLFEATIERLVALAVLMPIVASMGGNAGTQTLTVVIRGLGQGTISSANVWRVLRKEFLLGGLNGLIWAVAGVTIPLLLQRLGVDPALAGGVALTTVTDVVGFFSLLGLAAVFLV